MSTMRGLIQVIFVWITYGLISCQIADSFTLVMMGGRKRGRGNLKRVLDDSNSGLAKSPRAANQGKGQEITGVTLPAEGQIKGWEFGDKVRMACCNVDNEFYALQGDCPRCAFDLWKGNLITSDMEGMGGFTELPRVACPTCAVTYSMRTGKPGPAMKRKGLQGFVTGLAKSATVTDANKLAKAFLITRDPETGRVFCRER